MSKLDCALINLCLMKKLRIKPPNSWTLFLKAHKLSTCKDPQSYINFLLFSWGEGGGLITSSFNFSLLSTV